MKANDLTRNEGKLSVCRLRLSGPTPPSRRAASVGRNRWPAKPQAAGIALLLALLALSTAAAQPNLSTVKTKHYLIHSDLDDALVYDLGRRMDAMYDEYSRRLSDFDLRAD